MLTVTLQSQGALEIWPKTPADWAVGYNSGELS